MKVGIIGSTGYAGAEIVRILMNHPEAEIIWYGSRSYVDKKFSEVFGNMSQIVEDVCKGENISELSEKADVIFSRQRRRDCVHRLLMKRFLRKPRLLTLALISELKMLLHMKNGIR